MRKLRLGISGLGRGAVLTVPSLAAHPAIEIAAAHDPSPDTALGFHAIYGARLHESFDRMCADPSLDAIYIASPHEHHARQTISAVKAGKHVLVEKPMAVTLEEAAAMVEAARSSGVRLIVGPSHGFDPPVAAAADMIGSGEFGPLGMIQAFNHTDFLRRPRRPEELDTGRGGGVVHSQATHQVDLVRRLARSPVESVRARTGGWEPARPGMDGAYSALLFFESGCWASLTYSGHGHWNSDILAGGVTELGIPGRGEQRAVQPVDEQEAKKARGFAGATKDTLLRPIHHEHFGFVLACCQEADLEIGVDGVIVHRRGESSLHKVPLPPSSRHEVADALVTATSGGEVRLFDGLWGLETLACCHSILRSSREGRDVRPSELIRSSREDPK